MIGYCATASSGIEMAPIRQMKSATTQAKIGLSMKKLGINRYRCCACLVCLATAVSAEASPSVNNCGLTLSPAANF